MSQKTNQQAGQLLTLYSSLYAKRYNKPAPIVNRYRDKWGFVDVIESVGFEEAKKLLTYYVNSDNSASTTLQFFFYNFDKVANTMANEAVDKENIKKTMLETKKRVEAWNEQQRSKGNHSTLPE